MVLMTINISSIPCWKCFRRRNPRKLFIVITNNFNGNPLKKIFSKNSSFNGDFETYEKNFVEVLNNHAPKKVKVLWGNEKLHLNKILRKAMMKRSRLKNKDNKTEKPTDIGNYKRQQNYVVNDTHEENLCFNHISIITAA